MTKTAARKGRGGNGSWLESSKQRNEYKDLHSQPTNQHTPPLRPAFLSPLKNDLKKQVLVAQKVTAGVYKGVTTHELDELAAETAASMTAKHPDYSTLAARIAVSNLHKSTNKSFSETVKLMRGYVNERNGKDSPLVSVALQLRHGACEPP